jgi:hypothetical protein
MKPEITTFLVADGWRKYSSIIGRAQEYWCKRWPSAPRCECNQSKEGVQVVVHVYEFERGTGFEIELTAEKPDGVWVKLMCYGIGEELPTVLNTQAEQLVAAWTAIHASTPAAKNLLPGAK